MAKYQFGEDVPLAEPSWYQNLNTPYFKETHKKWRTMLRDFTEAEVIPIVDDWDDSAVKGDLVKCEKYIKDLYRKTAAAGILPGAVGVPWPAKWTPHPEPEGYDYFHELITGDELSRTSGGVVWALIEGLNIGCTPLLTFGVPQDTAKSDRVLREVLAGEKIICLCITEPTMGSDVANLKTTAEDKGDHYLVNGEKKWITNGIYADYFSCAVRVGGPGAKGIAMLLIERGPGIETRKMECTGVWPSGTTFVTFKNVKVPKTNIIGKKEEGFKQIMYNFNHERWMFAVQSARLARVCIEESLKFARQRQTFGKYLIEHQVIQHKIGEMSRLVESLQGWLENITYQMCTMSKDEQNKKLGGHIALLKLHGSRTMEYCASQALQVFGGTGYTRTGKGAKVERIYREVKAYAIPGGSEEIMLQIATGQFGWVSKKMPDPAKKQIEKLKKEVEELKSQLKGNAKL